MNKDSEQIFYGKAEPYLAEAADGTPFQLMRVGYYKKCRKEDGGLALSEIVSLKILSTISAAIPRLTGKPAL